MCIHNTDNLNLTKISKGIAELVSHARLKSFTQVLAGFLSRYCSYDEITILACSPNEVPALVYPQGYENHTPMLQDYFNSEYLMDPSLNPEITGDRSVFRLTDLYQDSLTQDQFYRRYYQHLGYSDEVLLSIKVGNENRIIISLGRKTVLGKVSRRELNQLQDLYPMIKVLVQQFWLYQGDNYCGQIGEGDALGNALQSFGRGILTRREQEVSALILKGYSSKCIARNLDISVGTVKVHRRNIHSRMKTSTQTDLFKEFLAYLDGLISQAA